MKRKITEASILSFFMFVCSLNALGQINIGGKPYSWENAVNNSPEIPVVRFAAPDKQRLEQEDEKDEKNGRPPRFGYKNGTDLSPENSGIWTILPDSNRLWRLELNCSTALSINLLFDKFWLPEGAKLYIYSKDKQYLIGGFTNANNKGDLENISGFGTGLVYGDEVIMEYYQPNKVSHSAIIHISGVVHGYRYIRVPNQTKSIDNFGNAGGCEININCQEGNNWQNEKRGVAMILVGGTRWCTGSLVNNTSMNGDLFFLTANHCLDSDGDGNTNYDATSNTNLSSYSFWWNYEAPSCSTPSNEPSAQITNGATLLANNATSDFALFRLVESPLSYNVFFNGWNASGSSSQTSVGIHHPKGDVKKISTYNGTLGIVGTQNTYGGFFNEVSGSNYWFVNGWTSGIVEGGSSGSPLFSEQNHLIIGQLKGDSVSCSGTYSYYGRASSSWNSNSSNQRQLKYWLDPNGTGNTSVQGGNWSCNPVVTVSNPINQGGEIRASNHITANSIIESGANVTMRAGSYIEFTDGFDSKTGSTLLAEIASCNNRVIPPAKILTMNSETVQDFSPIKFYPNPTSGKVAIDFYPSDETIDFSVESIVGQNIINFKKTYTQGQVLETIDLSNQTDGVYLISVKGRNYNTTQKIILQKN